MRSRQTENRIALGTFINKVGIMVYLYSRCDENSLECYRILGKKKYSNYTRRGCVCNVYDMTASEVERISKEGDRLDSEIQKSFKAIREAIARIERFKRLRKVLKERKLEIIRRRLNNIKELERIEKEERNTTSSSEIPFDPITIFEQFSSEVPESQWDSLLFSVPPDVIFEEIPRS